MAYSRTYTWDPNGNRLQQSDNGVLTTGAFNAANQLTLLTPTTGTPTLSYYDAAGNLTGMNCGGALTTQTWSPENKLTAIVSPTENESYLCSADGLRKSQTTASGTTLLTYDEVLVLLETDTSGNLQARNTDSPENFGGLVSQNRSGVSSWYGYDSQGSTRILVSVGGLITDSYSYKIFGELIQSGSGTVNPHTYVGIVRYRQQTNGYYLLSLRILDPFTGMFISFDPIGFRGGRRSPYEYARNNPAVWADPGGQDPTGPKYNPEYWNDPDRIRKSNCTCYAWCLDIHRQHGMDPGYISCELYPNWIDGKGYSCFALLHNSIHDGLINVPASNECPEFWHKVELYISKRQTAHTLHLLCMMCAG
jgi:RHS repeat-associated protein